MLHTRVIVTGFTDHGSSRTEDRGAKFRDAADIERVKTDLIKKIGPFFSRIQVTTRETS
jgi:hypothetical protein